MILNLTKIILQSYFVMDSELIIREFEVDLRSHLIMDGGDS